MEIDMIHHRTDDEYTATAFLEEVVLFEWIRNVLGLEPVPLIANHEVDTIVIALASDVYELVGVGLVSVNDTVVDDLRDGDHDAVKNGFLKPEYVVNLKDEGFDQVDIAANTRNADGLCHQRIVQIRILLNEIITLK
jgi:hypothetical protein